MFIPWAEPSLNSDDKKAIQAVVRTNWLSMGPCVKRFENLLSSYLHITHATAVNSGTAALDVALKCLKIGKGDEVIVPALTYIATGNAVLYNHATPVIVDIDSTLNIDVSLIEEKITDCTRAIMTIDFGGNVADYSGLQRLLKKYGIPLIVDGAQSLGSEDHRKKCCTHGRINTTSFHAAKILTTIEGGMLFTESQNIYRSSLQIRNQGESTKYLHSCLGHNYRMPDILAAIGCSQLQRFPLILKQRRKVALRYKEFLKGVSFPEERAGTVNSYFLFPIMTKQRNRLKMYLQKEGIDTRITYPRPLNEQPLFKAYGKGGYPMAQQVAKHIIALPIYNGLTLEQQEYIIKKINNYKW
jgi:perosamine synthetase